MLPKIVNTVISNCCLAWGGRKKLQWQETDYNFSHSADTIVYKLRYITWICTLMEFRIEDFFLTSMCVCTSTCFVVTLSASYLKKHVSLSL